MATYAYIYIYIYGTVLFLNFIRMSEGVWGRGARVIQGAGLTCLVYLRGGNFLFVFLPEFEQRFVRNPVPNLAVV
jgi:hypothetical protein